MLDYDRPMARGANCVLLFFPFLCIFFIIFFLLSLSTRRLPNVRALELYVGAVRFKWFQWDMACIDML